MIRRILALAFALLGASWLLRRAMGGGASPIVSHPAGPRFEGAMVRDRICDTFLPRSRALAVRCGDEEHFFCSESCRAAFLSRRRQDR